MKSEATWNRRIASIRIVLSPQDMLCSESCQMLDPQALGILLRLLPYVAIGSEMAGSGDLKYLARYAQVHPKTFRKAWPSLERLFEVRDGRLTLKPLPWLHVQTVSADRQNLKHLLEQLVEFWGNACVYCGTESGNLHIEHIVPLIRGGTDDIKNLTLACRRCNAKKGRKTAAEFGHPHIHETAAGIQ